MAIYRIDNVERSGIGQYGEVIWNFPEAYNDAKDGDVLDDGIATLVQAMNATGNTGTASNTNPNGNSERSNA